MGLENPTYIGDFNLLWPEGTDPKSQGDDHIRNIKSAVVNTFGALTAPLEDSSIFMHLDGRDPMAAAMDLGGFNINNVADPTTEQQAATKNYVDLNGFGGQFQSGDEIMIRLADTTLVPAGWQLGTVNDVAPRIIGDAVAGDGGSIAFSSLFTASEVTNAAGAHTHSLSGNTSTAPGSTTAAGGSTNTYTLQHSHTISGTALTNGNHSHTFNNALSYRDYHTIIKI